MLADFGVFFGIERLAAVVMERQQYLDQTVEIIEAPVGKGRIVLFGPET